MYRFFVEFPHLIFRINNLLFFLGRSVNKPYSVAVVMAYTLTNEVNNYALIY